MSADRDNWVAANQRYLMARLAVVREALGSCAAQGKSQPGAGAYDAEERVREAAEAMPSPAALDNLCATFRLSPFEQSILLLCAGMELDGSFPSLCAAAHAEAQRACPTFSLALAALPGAHWSALTPAAPLRNWRLVEIGAGETLTNSPIRIDERVLHYLTGISCLDARLRSLIEPEPPPSHLPPSQHAQAHRIVEVWSRARQELPLVHLGGDEQEGKRAAASHACQALGLQLYVLRAADLPQSVVEREAFARLWEREAALSHAALLIDCEDSEAPPALRPFVEQVSGMLLVASREPLGTGRRRSAHVMINRPSADEQQRLWREALGELAPRLDGQVEALVAQFDLRMDEIRAAGAQITADDGPEAQQDIAGRLWEICRTSARTKIDDLAQRIEPVAGWEDLVLPPAQMQTLREVAAQVRQRSRVYESWGFASKGKRGLGISALFAGASGTGKTMAAEVLARELRLDLYGIDLSQVVSKYIGETEKNLRRVFDAAEAGGAVLLFDEADALFGKRSEVKDSHDRYANIEVSYLLQRMEAYRGLAILTTNMKSVLDTSFLRRIRFIVQFPFPDATHRAEIWRRIFPAETPTENLDMTKLARLNVVGGNIRNIALQAAFLAADQNEPVRMAHLLRAARTEYTKLEQPLTDTEVRDWV
jgi:hypothetical protein